MATIGAHGITARLPAGFEGRIFVRPATVGVTYPVGQFATFPIPDDIGDFGSGAVTLMGPSDVFATLFEYGPESVGKALFARQGRPDVLSESDFSPMTLRRGIPGQSGTQWFFTESGRPFAFYAVLGSHSQRAALVPHVNTLLSSLDPEPGRVRPPGREAPHGTDRPLPDCRRPALRRRRGEGAAPRRHGVGHGGACPRGVLRCAVVRPAVRIGALAEAAFGAVADPVPAPGHGRARRTLLPGFIGVVAVARWRGGPLATCGCFGRPDTPPTALHLVLDLALAVAAAAVALGAPPQTRSDCSWPISPGPDSLSSSSVRWVSGSPRSPSPRWPPSPRPGVAQPARVRAS